MSDDEKLSGFVDRELDGKTQADLEALIAQDDQIKARLSRIQTNDDLVRKAFDAPVTEAVPDRFVAAIDAGLAKHSNAAEVNARPPQASNDNNKAWWQIGGAVAASLAVGLFFGAQLAPGGADATMSVALNDALNATPSAQTASLKSGERLTPQLTFARAGGGYCRQFDISAANGVRSGVACNREGRWTMEALMPSSAGASAEEGYVTAEGPTNMALENLVNRLRTGDPLDKPAEDAVIARGWK
jgi:negative regulator of sigma E activity